MPYLIRVTCPHCARDYRFSNEATELERLCPFADCLLTEGDEHDAHAEFDGSHWRWVCSCGRKGIRLAYREDVERLADEHVAKASTK